jgi:hypothetical protein
LTLTSLSGALTPGAVTLTVTPTAQWSGGNILLGGAGTDQFHLVGGNNVVHGTSYLHVCIFVGNGKFTGAVAAVADTNCKGVANNGFSTMSLLAPFMDNGTCISRRPKRCERVGKYCLHYHAQLALQER